MLLSLDATIPAASPEATAAAASRAPGDADARGDSPSCCFACSAALIGENPPEVSALLIAAWLTSGLDLPEAGPDAPEAAAPPALYVAAVYEAVLLVT
jgi:hypothetical protein